MNAKRINSILLFLLWFSLLQGQVTRSESVSIILNAKNKNEVAKSEIQIIAPSFTKGTTFKTTDSRVELIGRIEKFSGIGGTVIVKSEKVEVDKAGVFKTPVWLESGTNEILITAIDDKNNQLTEVIKMEYEPPEVAFADSIKNEAIFYGLIIAVNDYQDPKFESLDRPINDAQKLYNVLISKYTFSPENVQVIKNPTRKDIINALEYLAKKVTQKDNLLIFYAGHGFWNENSNVGFWLPSDAREDSKDKWFPNSELVDYLKEIKSKHILLIADACFSGSIFKSRFVSIDRAEAPQDLYKLPSREAMTSGTLTKVPDRSAFTKYLIEQLADINEQVFTSDQLFKSFQTAVENNSDAKPRYGVIENVDDKGGEFVFIKK
ncbi:MAG: caspase family protein [Bacteroidales bacterium]|jgi:hypothetical protein